MPRRQLAVYSRGAWAVPRRQLAVYSRGGFAEEEAEEEGGREEGRKEGGRKEEGRRKEGGRKNGSCIRHLTTPHVVVRSNRRSLSRGSVGRRHV